MIGNHVELLGNLTRPIELRYTPNQTAIGSFSVAVNRQWTDDNGQKKEEVAFIDCEIWAKSAESMAEWTTKGSKVLLQGRIKQDTWEDKQSGQTRSKLKVVVEGWKNLTPKSQDARGDADDSEPRQRTTQTKKTPPRSNKPPRDPDLDIDEEPEFLPDED